MPAAPVNASALRTPHRPYVVANFAMSADGKIAPAHGASGAISSRADRHRMDDLRATMDAVLIGAGTLRSDDPPLHLRQEPAISARRAAGYMHQPRAIVLSRSGDVPPGARIFAGHAPSLGLHPAPRPLVVTCDAGLSQATRRVGHLSDIWSVGSDAVKLDALWPRLMAAGLRRLMVEGGGETLWAFAAAEALDALYLTVAPCLLGGVAAATPLGGAGWPLAQRRRLQLVDAQIQGDEIFCHYRVTT